MMKSEMVKRNLFFLILSVFLFFSSKTNFSWAQNQTDWPTFHGNSARTGFSTSAISPKPQVLWQLTIQDLRNLGVNQFESSSPVITDNQVFVAFDKKVLALNLKNGQLLWQYQDNQASNFYPRGLAVFDQRLIVTVNDNSLIKNMRTGLLYALDAKVGRMLWKQATTGALSHSLPLVAEDKVFVGDDSGTLNAFDLETGQVLWQKKLVEDGEIHASPAYDYDQDLIFIATEGDANYHGTPPSHPSSIFAIKADTGQIVWQFPIDYKINVTNLVHSTPAITNGALFIGSENGWFYALSTKDGSLLWQRELVTTGQNLVGSSAAAGLGQDKVYVPLWAGKLLALDQKSGKTAWEFSYEGQGTDSSPVITEKAVCFGAHQGYFYCLEAETGKALWQEKLGGPSAALSQNILIVPNALAGETPDESETPVLIAFSDQEPSQVPSLANLDLKRALPTVPALLILLGGGGLLLFAFFKLKPKIIKKTHPNQDGNDPVMRGKEKNKVLRE